MAQAQHPFLFAMLVAAGVACTPCAGASEISDYIAAKTPAVVAAQLRELGQSHAGWRVFNMMWTTPNEILAAATSLGWSTRAQAESWVNRMRDTITMQEAGAIEARVYPRLDFDLDAMPQVLYGFIHTQAAAQTLLRSDFFTDQSDRHYRLPSLAQLQRLADIQPFRTRQFASETMDCDDYVRAFLGWLAASGYGNLAIGHASITYYQNGTLLGGHAVALAVDDTGKVWFIDPQTRGLHDPMKSRTGGAQFWGATELKLARLYF